MVNYVQPKQSRSEETFARIVDAAERMYRLRRSCEVPVRELAEEARASRSSFYARFPDADALVHVVFERFSARVLGLAAELDADWTETRSGGDDFAEFVHTGIDRYTSFWRAEGRLIQAFRAAEQVDASLRTKRQWLDAEIVRRLIRVVANHYSEIDTAALTRELDDGMALIAAAFRGGTDNTPQLGLSSPDSHEKVVRGLSQLVMSFVPR